MILPALYCPEDVYGSDVITVVYTNLTLVVISVDTPTPTSVAEMSQRVGYRSHVIAILDLARPAAAAYKAGDSAD